MHKTRTDTCLHCDKMLRLFAHYIANVFFYSVRRDARFDAYRLLEQHWRRNVKRLPNLEYGRDDAVYKRRAHGDQEANKENGSSTCKQNQLQSKNDGC